VTTFVAVVSVRYALRQKKEWSIEHVIQNDIDSSNPKYKISACFALGIKKRPMKDIMSKCTIIPVT